MSDVPLETDPGLLFKWKLDLDKFVAGGDKNKLLIGLVCATSRNSRQIHAVVTGESSSGKSHVTKNVLQYFPDTIMFSRITEHSLDRLQQDLTGKVLFVEELAGASKAQNTIRILMSEGKLALLTNVYDDNGNLAEKSKRIETQGKPVFITTTTAPSLEQETATRVLIISIDETEEQTKRILEMEAQEVKQLRTFNQRGVDEKIKQVIQNLTPSSGVIIPYSEQLTRLFPHKNVKSRRDYRKLLDTIEIITFIHQHNRPKLYTPFNFTSPVLISLPLDFFLAWRIIDETIIETVTSLSKRMQRVLSLFPAEEQLKVEDIAKGLNYSANRSGELLRELWNQSFLMREKLNNKVFTYWRNPDKPLITPEIKEIVLFLNNMDESKVKTFLDSMTRELVYNMKREKGIVIDDKPELDVTCIDLEDSRIKVDWRFGSVYVDPLTGQEFILGTPEFAEFFTSIVSTSLVSSIPSPKRLSNEEKTDENNTIRDSKQKINPDQLIRGFLGEKPKHCATLQEIDEFLQGFNITNAEELLEKCVKSNYLYKPKANEYGLAQETLWDGKDAGVV